MWTWAVFLGLFLFAEAFAYWRTGHTLSWHWWQAQAQQPLLRGLMVGFFGVIISHLGWQVPDKAPFVVIEGSIVGAAVYLIRRTSTRSVS